jgi:hypothetical protein
VSFDSYGVGMTPRNLSAHIGKVIVKRPTHIGKVMVKCPTHIGKKPGRSLRASGTLGGDFSDLASTRGRIDTLRSSL